MARSDYWTTVQVFQDALQAAVACFSSAILLRKGPFAPDEPRALFVLSESLAPLKGSNSVNAFSLTLKCNVERRIEQREVRWEIQTYTYSCGLYRNGREIIVYHWDRDAAGDNAVLTPHAHFGKDLPSPTMTVEDRAVIGTLAAAHMPTGTVPFTALLRIVIRDFGVEPMRNHRESAEDARARTDDALAAAETLLMASFDWWRHPLSNG